MMVGKGLITLLLHCFMASLLVLWLAAPVEAAMTQPFQDAITQFEEGGPITKEVFDKETIENAMNTINYALGEKKEGEGETGSRRGAVGIIASLNGTLYTTQPASSIEYLADLGQNLGLVPAAYAQGFGWHAFSPVLEIWKIFRNLAYLAFIVIFVVIGFMIMFRKKIDPQTVISVQNALPRIIVTLILITFSYAIAGFIIDLGQLATRIVGNLLVTGDLLGAGLSREGLTGAEYSLRDLLSADIFKLINPLRNVNELTTDLFDISVGPTALIKPIAWITAKTVFWIAGFFIMFKILFALISPYVGIVLSVVFAPLQLLLGAIPGTEAGLGSWLRNLAANVAVFPVTFAMLCIAAIFKSGPMLAQCPPPVSNIGPGAAWCTSSQQFILPWSPTTIGNWGQAAGQLIGFGILFTIPKVAQMVQGALQIKPSPWGEAAGEEIRAAVGKVPLLGTFVRV